MGTGPLHRPEAARDPGHRDVRRPLLPHQPLGLRVHRRRPGEPDDRSSRTGAVGIIGTGATAVQCIPPLGRDAGELFVFQRTPSSIDERNNHAIDPEWFATLGPGWQREWLVNFATLQTGGFADEDLVKDGWTDIAQRIRDRVIANMAEGDGVFDLAAFERAYEDSDDEKMEEIRARVDAVVADPETAGRAQAVVPPAVQAAVLPRRVPAGVQPPERAPRRHRRSRASSASTRPASGSAASTTSSTA